jgi:two-component system, OmpR family, phosphate regulon response regulator OmpR
MSTDPATRPLLLVEDDETLGNILARHLRAHGHPVVIAGSTEETIAALLRGLRPSMLLLDINLPGETGWSVLRSDAFKAAGSPPVVVASAMSVDPARLREFGIAGYLPKPFGLDTLRSTIERVLGSQGET